MPRNYTMVLSRSTRSSSHQAQAPAHRWQSDALTQLLKNEAPAANQAMPGK
ncbi:hypothetical protein [Acidovorax sp. JHL-9]|uniref:hypothetical protein n=1 Tax=Acidovorax sp. JHL-9 TaxID=1276756 RepID=UPI0012DF23C5|nr:hypothetical protein [Acidovorax sp. JHL-9]